MPLVLLRASRRKLWTAALRSMVAFTCCAIALGGSLQITLRNVTFSGSLLANATLPHGSPSEEAPSQPKPLSESPGSHEFSEEASAGTSGNVRAGRLRFLQGYFRAAEKRAGASHLGRRHPVHEFQTSEFSARNGCGAHLRC